MKKYPSLLAMLFVFSPVVSCKTENKKNKLTDPLASIFDSTVISMNDFFDLANGKWFSEHSIPAGEQSNLVNCGKR